MSSNGKELKSVVCPFYHKTGTERIYCEGTEDNNTINLVFGSRQEMFDYEQCFCDDMDFHKDCLIYQMLMKKWEERR